MKKRLLITMMLVAVVAAMVPLIASAATTPDIISVMSEVMNGILSAGRDAYCALGVTAFCP